MHSSDCQTGAGFTVYFSLLVRTSVRSRDVIMVDFLGPIRIRKFGPVRLIEARSRLELSLAMSSTKNCSFLP